jgi:hypothetical protein
MTQPNRAAAKASLRRFWSSPPFPKGGRSGLINFPIEKIIIARPHVDLGLANLTLETAKMLIWMLLPCRSVRQPAIGTGKIFGHPYVACHPAIIPMWRLLHRPACPNSCATINERFNGMHRNRRGPTATPDSPCLTLGSPLVSPGWVGCGTKPFRRTDEGNLETSEGYQTYPVVWKGA